MEMLLPFLLLFEYLHHYFENGQYFGSFSFPSFQTVSFQYG